MTFSFIVGGNHGTRRKHTHVTSHKRYHSRFYSVYIVENLTKKSNLSVDRDWYHSNCITGAEPVIKMKVGIPITCLTPPHVCVSLKSGPGFPMWYVLDLICVQWVKVRGDSWFCWYWWICWSPLSKLQKLEYTKGVIRIRISKKNRQHNGQKKKYKRTNNDLQNIHIKLKIE
jgi:hypothetical protein